MSHVIIDVMTGEYLKSYDPDFTMGDAPTTGLADWTDDVREALLFPGAGEAIECWQQVSTVRPTRPDGKPNKPLTAYTVELRALTPDEEKATT